MPHTTDIYFLTVLEGGKSRIKVPTWFSFCWDLPSHLPKATFSLGPHVACPPCVRMDGEPVSSLVSLLIRTLILSDQGPTLMTSFNPKYFPFNPCTSQCSTNIATLGVRAPTYELGGRWGDRIHSVHNNTTTTPMEKFVILWNLGKLFTQSVSIYSVPSMCQAIS